MTVSLTVTVMLSVALPQVAVMTAVPAPMPVTTPSALTVATSSFEDDHSTVASAGLRDAVSCTVLVMYTTAFVSSLMSTVYALTVISMLSFTSLPTLTLIVAVPALTPVTSPFSETVATAVSEDAQTTSVDSGFLFAESCSVCPSYTSVTLLSAIDTVTDGVSLSQAANTSIDSIATRTSTATNAFFLIKYLLKYALYLQI